jgi:hypothetical protein
VGRPNPCSISEAKAGRGEVDYLEGVGGAPLPRRFARASGSFWMAWLCVAVCSSGMRQLCKISTTISTT